jgi:hypothetical protein
LTTNIKAKKSIFKKDILLNDELFKTYCNFYYTNTSFNFYCLIINKSIPNYFLNEETTGHNTFTLPLLDDTAKQERANALNAK